MISLAGLLLFAGIARFALVTITVLHEPRVLMFHGRLAVAVSGVTCCTAVSAGMVWWLSVTTVVENFQLGTSRLYDSHLSFNFFFLLNRDFDLDNNQFTNQSIHKINNVMIMPAEHYKTKIKEWPALGSGKIDVEESSLAFDRLWNIRDVKWSEF